MHVQLAECPELPKPKPKPKAIPATQPAKVRTPLPAAAPKPRQDAAAPGPHRQAMDILQDLMDLSFDLAQDMVEDATKAGLTEPPPPQQPGTIDIRCARSPRKAPPPPNICGRPGAAGFGLAAYGLCFLKASRGRLVCGRMAVVPAVGVPRTLLSTLLPVMLPAQVIAVEVHVHEDVAEALVAGGDMGGLDDGTGLQLDLAWGIVGRESKGVAKVVQQLEVRTITLMGMVAYTVLACTSGEAVGTISFLVFSHYSLCLLSVVIPRRHLKRSSRTSAVNRRASHSNHLIHGIPTPAQAACMAARCLRVHPSCRRRPARPTAAGSWRRMRSRCRWSRTWRSGC